MQFLSASASVSSSVTPSAHLLRLSRPLPFPHLRRRCSPPRPLALTPRPPLLLVSRSSVLFTPRAHGDHSHGHGHHHHHHHGHDHGHHEVDLHGGGGGTVVMRVARAIGWADVADALREHLQACCISLGNVFVVVTVVGSFAKA